MQVLLSIFHISSEVVLANQTKQKKVRELLEKDLGTGFEPQLFLRTSKLQRVRELGFLWL